MINVSAIYVDGAVRVCGAHITDHLTPEKMQKKGLKAGLTRDGLVIISDGDEASVVSLNSLRGVTIASDDVSLFADSSDARPTPGAKVKPLVKAG